MRGTSLSSLLIRLIFVALSVAKEKRACGLVSFHFADTEELIC